MSGTIYGTGRTRRDDILNRVMDTIYKGQPIPLGWHNDPATMQAFSFAALQNATVVDTVSQTGFKLIVCGTSKAGSSDVCG
jgi:hypothetical protein